jgi:hypothetical protein
MPKYGWMRDGAEKAHGGFVSMEKAKVAALKATKPGEAFLLGTCQHLDPVQCMKDLGDLDSALEALEEEVPDEFEFCEGPLIVIKGTNRGTDKERLDKFEAAQKDLAHRLRAWAKKWLRSSAWCLDVKARIIHP